MFLLAMLLVQFGKQYVVLYFLFHGSCKILNLYHMETLFVHLLVHIEFFTTFTIYRVSFHHKNSKNFFIRLFLFSEESGEISVFSCLFLVGVSYKCVVASQNVFLGLINHSFRPKSPLKSHHSYWINVLRCSFLISYLLSKRP